MEVSPKGQLNTGEINAMLSLHNRQKLAALKSSLLLAIFISIVFAVLDFKENNQPLATIQSCAGVVYISLFLLIIRSDKHMNTVSLIFLSFFFTTLLFFYYSTRTHETVFMWTVICCFLVQFFTDIKTGTIFSIIIVFITTIFIFRRYYIDPVSMPIVALSQLIFVNLAALIFSFFYELRRVKAEQALNNANRQLENMATHDGLTGLYNRRFFNDVLKKEWLRMQRANQPLSLILSDIDYFKGYNDNYGHLAGDKCLQEVADTFLASVRRVSDIAARYGGEEFAIILPDTESDGAKKIAQFIKDSIKEKGIEHTASKVSDIVTLSFGIATLIPNDSITTDSFITMADNALYQSKEKGRNMITVCCDFPD